ncbi:hypothetical protein GFJ25_23500, partial [Escherichia coli]|nr:hypothetical protein [Escherichia coli]
LTFQNHTNRPLTDFGGKTSIFSHPVYLFLRKFSLQDSRGGSIPVITATWIFGLLAEPLMELLNKTMPWHKLLVPEPAGESTENSSETSQ